jgi:nucleoside-diphosphate-sugar epimerase
VLKVNNVFLVTGATGYLAVNFLNFIQVSSPDFFKIYDAVLLLDRHLKLSRLDVDILRNNNVKASTCDLSQVKDFSQVFEDLLINAKDALSKLEGAVHNAPIFSLEILHFASVNNLEAEKLFIKELHEFALKTKSLIKLIYLSSSAVYGENDSDPLIPSGENDVLRPVSTYGSYKLEIEKFIQELFGKYEIAKTDIEGRIREQCFLLIRLANPYGGEFDCKGVYQNFKKQLLDTAQDEHFTVKINAEAEGQIIRDFVNIRDFCLILLRLIELKASGIYNVASEKVTYLEDFAESVRNDLLINSLIDSNFAEKRINVEYQGFKANDIKVSHLSSQKLNELLNF